MIYDTHGKLFRKIHIALFIAMVLAGCGNQSATPTVDLNQVATVVAATIMSMPTVTNIPQGEALQPSAVDIPVTDTPLAELPTESPTVTLSPTNTEMPTQTATPTLNSADPLASLGNPTWKASFINGSSWYTFEDFQSSIQIKNGTLMLKALKANSYENWSMASPDISNFYLEIQGTTGDSCQGKDRFGIIFRAPDTNQGYLFGISCDGSYRVRAWNGEKFTELLGWQQSEFIKSGPKQSNRIGVMARGTELSFYINGNLVDQFSDDTYAKGVFGAYIASANTLNFTVNVSNAAYWDLP
jgi:hypothetical protein